MKLTRVPDDLIEAGFDAIRAWYAAHPGPNAYLDDRTRMRLVLAAVLTLHNEQVEQPLRERAEVAERELAELRDEYANLEAESSQIASRAGRYRKELAEFCVARDAAVKAWNAQQDIIQAERRRAERAEDTLAELRKQIGKGVTELKSRADGGCFYAANMLTHEAGYSRGIRDAYTGAAVLVGEWKAAGQQPEADAEGPS